MDAATKTLKFNYLRMIEIAGVSRGFAVKLRSEMRHELGERKYAKPHLGFIDLVQVIVARDIVDAGIPTVIAARALVASRGLTSKVTIPIKHSHGRPLCGLTIDYPAAFAEAHRLLIEHGEIKAPAEELPPPAAFTPMMAPMN